MSKPMSSVRVTPRTSRSGRTAQDVAHAAHRLEQSGIVRVLLDLRAQPVDMDVDGPGQAGVVGLPNVLQELVTSEHLAGVAKQEGEELEGLRFDGECLAVA